MSVRVGLSFGGFPFSGPKAFWRWIDACEDGNVDSIFLPDRIVGGAPIPETLITLAAIAGRTRRLKFGSDVIVLPVRDPVLLAKECATLDMLSDGRFLPMFGVGGDQIAEWDAMRVSPKNRGRRANEMLEIMARLWTEDRVDYEGRDYVLHNVSVNPKPKQSPLPFWIGGVSEGAIDRTARYAHGWIGGSTSVPEEVARTVAAIKAKAVEYGRVIEEDHYGAGFNYRFGAWDEPIVQRMVQQTAARMGGRDPKGYMAVGSAADILEMFRTHRNSGVHKFVLRPIADGDEDMTEQAQRLSREVIPLVEKM